MSELETLFAFQCRAVGLPEPTPQYRFHSKRKWRLDFAWVDLKVAVETHGGTWSRGRHTRGGGFAKDREKMNAAILLGWRVLEFTSDMVSRGEAVEVTEQLIKQCKE